MKVCRENIAFFQALASEPRLHIIELLTGRQMNLRELVDELEMSVTIVSRHVKSLENVGIVRCVNTPSARGLQKLCSLAMRGSQLEFTSLEAARNQQIYDIPVGQYVEWSENRTCGMSTESHIIGEVDDPRYALFFAAALRDYHRTANDMETVRELWPSALRQIELACAEFDSRGIVRDRDQLGWCFVDWNLALNKQASAQGIYLYCLKAAIELAQILNLEEVTSGLRREYVEKKAAAIQYLWDDGERLFISGADRQISWASQVWMVLGGAVDGQNAAELLERASRHPEIMEMVTPYMYHNYVDALLAAQQRDRALEVLRSYCGGMASEGSDTFWELYNAANPDESPYGGTIVNSYCYAWSCVPAYFLRKYYQ